LAGHSGAYCAQEFSFERLAQKNILLAEAVLSGTRLPVLVEFDVKEEDGMREAKEIREALKRLKDEHLRRARDPSSYSPPMLVAMIGTLEWVLGDRKRLPDFL